jgi:hypothetical protein
MKWLRNYKLFKESKEVKSNYSPKNIVQEVCISMCLLNPEFLDNILDRGLKARYSEDSSVFLTDLKNLLLSKNRLTLGKFIDNKKCVEDDEISKLNGYFNEVDFSIDKDWNKLSDSRTTARNIMDKLLGDEKLTSERIRKIYWIGPNKSKDFNEDIVIETTEGKQFSIFLNKNLSTQKTSSFNTFGDDLIGPNMEKLYSDEYMPRWNKLVQTWVTIIYENADKPIQRHIEKFIDPKRIETMGYFEYFDIKHQDPRYKHLGEFFREFDKNILKFSDLCDEIWKNKDNCFMDVERVKKEWYESKIVILNSKILENLLTNSLKSEFSDEIQKSDDGMKKAEGTVKMKLFKTIVEKMGCLERTLYFVSNNGNNFNVIPARDFFRKYYNDIELNFDYHVKFNYNEDDEELNDFKISLNLQLDGDNLIDMIIFVKFTGGELSSKLSAKYKFELVDDFNYRIAKKRLTEFEPKEAQEEEEEGDYNENEE